MSGTSKRTENIPDVRGISRLVVDAVSGVTDIVEDLHRSITEKHL